MADRLESAALLLAGLALALSIAVVAHHRRERSLFAPLSFLSLATLAFLPATSLWCLADALRVESRWEVRAAVSHEALDAALRDRLTSMASRLGAYPLSDERCVAAHLIAASNALRRGGSPGEDATSPVFATRGLGAPISPRLAREHISAAVAMLDELASEPADGAVRHAYTDSAARLASRLRTLAASLPDVEHEERSRAELRGSPFREERKQLAECLRDVRMLNDAIVRYISDETRTALASARDVQPGSSLAPWLWLAHALFAVSLGTGGGDAGAPRTSLNANRPRLRPASG